MPELVVEGSSYFINSLPSLYEALKKDGRGKVIEQAVTSFLTMSFNADIGDKVKRFLEIPSVFIPADKEYFKLYSELMQLYTNGLYYSTVVLSGVLCERICYDVLLRSKIGVEGTELSSEQVACLFEMNLAYLFKLLFDWGLIKEETKRLMNEVNQKRNEYVHPKKSKLKPQEDALEMIKKISKILATEFQAKIEPKGTVSLPQDMKVTILTKTDS